MTTCNAEDRANDLAVSLGGAGTSVPALTLTGSDYSFDPSTQGSNPLFATPEDIVIADVTQTTVEGAGAFDVMMRGVNAQIENQYDKGRITGAEFAQAYVTLVETTLNNAVQYTLTKDQARFSAISAQMQGRKAQIEATTALVDLETAKMSSYKLRADAENSNAQFRLTKMETAAAEARYCLTNAERGQVEFTLDKMLPVTLAQEKHRLSCLLPAETALVRERLEAERGQTLDFRSDGITPIQGILGRTKESAILDIETKNYTVNNMLPAQLKLVQEQAEAERAKTLDTRSDGVTDITGLLGNQRIVSELEVQARQYALDHTLPAQLDILKEQRESERAKTLDTRTDTTPVSGSVGKQKELYDQQIDSFDKDAKFKTAKMYLDGWITQKTLDEGLLAPTQLENANIDAVLTAVRTNNSL